MGWSSAEEDGMDFKEGLIKSPCPAKKFLAAGHIANFQTAPSQCFLKTRKMLMNALNVAAAGLMVW